MEEHFIICFNEKESYSFSVEEAEKLYLELGEYLSENKKNELTKNKKDKNFAIAVGKPIFIF